MCKIGFCKFFVIKFLLLLFLLCFNLSLALAGTLGISVSPTSYDFGTGGAGNYTSWKSTTDAGWGTFSVKSTGVMTNRVTITGSSSTIWDLGTSPGRNCFALQYGKTITPGVEPIWSHGQLTTGTVTLADNFTAGNTVQFDLRFQAPNSSTVDGLQNFKIIVKAEPPAGYNYFPEGDFYWKAVSFGGWESDWSGPYDHVLTESEFNLGAISINLWIKSGLTNGDPGIGYGWTLDPGFVLGQYWMWRDDSWDGYMQGYHSSSNLIDQQGWKVVVLD